ncbi:MAG: ADP-ribosylation factor-like protein [Candidatus Hodarchaeales archaeon]|jgi:GTPase SAR1 family protein
MLSDFLRLIKSFILVIGPTEAGKTSILRRLITGSFVEQEPTLGFREERIKKVRIIEIGGHHNFRKYWKDALDQNPLIFFVIDITKETDYNDYQQFIKDYGNDYPFINRNTTLIGNKLDLVSIIPDRFAKLESFIPSSAKNGEGMLDILEIISSHKDIVNSKTNSVQVERDDKREKEEAESLLKEFQGKF